MRIEVTYPRRIISPDFGIHLWFAEIFQLNVTEGEGPKGVALLYVLWRQKQQLRFHDYFFCLLC